MEFAFDIASADLIAGRPEWLYRASYDIVATTAAPSSRAQQKLMLQTLLADRFGLVCHRETKHALLYALTPGKQVKLVETKESGNAEVSRFMPRLVVHDDGSTETAWTAGHASLSDLAAWLSGQMAHPVADETGIHGLYDMKLFIPGGPAGKRGEPAEYPGPDDRDFIAAVQSQLGLKLTSRQGLLEMLVIDRIAKATEN